MAPVAPLTGVFLTQRQQTQSKSGCHATASSPRGRRRPGLPLHHTRGETVFTTVAQRPTAIPRPTTVPQEGGAVQRQSTSPSFTPPQRRAPPSPGTTQPPSPGLPPPKVGSRTIALPASKELEAFKTIQAVDCAVNAAQVALSGVTARRRRLSSQQEGMDQPLQKDSVGIDALKVARNETSPSVGVRRAASLAAARMEHKESVDALGRSQKFTHGVLEKLDALQLTAAAAQ